MARFNIFIWVSVARSFCSYEFGLVLLDWSHFCCKVQAPFIFSQWKHGSYEKQKKLSHLLHQHFFYTSLFVLLEYVSKERPIRFRSKVHSSSFKGCLGIKFDSFKGFLGAKF